jgi:hypothetical protein
VSVLGFMTTGASGMRHRFNVLSNQPCKMASHVTLTLVFDAL